MAAEDYFYDEDYDEEVECRYCGAECVWIQEAGYWVLFDLETDNRHRCQLDKKDDFKCFET